MSPELGEPVDRVATRRQGGIRRPRTRIPQAHYGPVRGCESSAARSRGRDAHIGRSRVVMKLARPWAIMRMLGGFGSHVCATAPAIESRPKHQGERDEQPRVDPFGLDSRLRGASRSGPPRRHGVHRPTRSERKSRSPADKSRQGNGRHPRASSRSSSPGAQRKARRCTSRKTCGASRRGETRPQAAIGHRHRRHRRENRRRTRQWTAPLRRSARCRGRLTRASLSSAPGGAASPSSRASRRTSTHHVRAPLTEAWPVARVGKATCTYDGRPSSPAGSGRFCFGASRARIRDDLGQQEVPWHRSRIVVFEERARNTAHRGGAFPS